MTITESLIIQHDPEGMKRYLMGLLKPYLGLWGKELSEPGYAIYLGSWDGSQLVFGATHTFYVGEMTPAEENRRGTDIPQALWFEINQPQTGRISIRGMCQHDRGALRDLLFDIWEQVKKDCLPVPSAAMIDSLDEIDQTILKLKEGNPDMDQTDIGKAPGVNLSRTAVNTRIGKLKAKGLVR